MTQNPCMLSDQETHQAYSTAPRSLDGAWIWWSDSGLKTVHCKTSVTWRVIDASIVFSAYSNRLSDDDGCTPDVIPDTAALCTKPTQDEL